MRLVNSLDWRRETNQERWSFLNPVKSKPCGTLVAFHWSCCLTNTVSTQELLLPSTATKLGLLCCVGLVALKLPVLCDGPSYSQGNFRFEHRSQAGRSPVHLLFVALHSLQLPNILRLFRPAFAKMASTISSGDSAGTISYPGHGTSSLWQFEQPPERSSHLT